MRSSSLGLAAVALLFGVGIGVFVVQGASSDPCLTVGDHILDVDLNHSVDCPKARIKRGKKHRVRWESPEGTTLEVKFQTSVPPSVPTPACRDNACVLGPVAGTVPASSSDGYPYEVTVTGSSAPASASSLSPTPPGPNGRIIIKK